jgi:hypothetical protein
VLGDRLIHTTLDEELYKLGLGRRAIYQNPATLEGGDLLEREHALCGEWGRSLETPLGLLETADPSI